MFVVLRIIRPATRPRRHRGRWVAIHRDVESSTGVVSGAGMSTTTSAGVACSTVLWSSTLVGQFRAHAASTPVLHGRCRAWAIATTVVGINGLVATPSVAGGLIVTGFGILWWRRGPGGGPRCASTGLGLALRGRVTSVGVTVGLILAGISCSHTTLLLCGARAVGVPGLLESMAAVVIEIILDQIFCRPVADKTLESGNALPNLRHA